MIGLQITQQITIVSTWPFILMQIVIAQRMKPSILQNNFSMFEGNKNNEGYDFL